MTIQGTHPVAIGPGTVIHPRARIFSFEGPIHIGDGCIISEKSTIGSQPVPVHKSTSTSTSLDNQQPFVDAPSPSDPTNSDNGESGGARGTGTGTGTGMMATRLSSSVTVGPHATILPGAYVRSFAVIDALAIVQRSATVGAHSKVCCSCEVPEGEMIGDWLVVWGNKFSGLGQRKRRRNVNADVKISAVMDKPCDSDNGKERLDGKKVEDARLIVLHKEREGLAKLIGMAANSQKRR